MAIKRDDRSPKAYRNAVDGELSEMLEEIRTAIFEAVPKIEEGIEHGMLDYPGLANLAAQKNYVALYVAPSVLAKHKDNFPGVSCGKSCLRFRKEEQVDSKALKKLLKAVRVYRSKV